MNTLSNVTQDEPIHELNVDFNENNENNTIIYGKLGINVKYPDEALTVVGNLKMTGNIYQPSDARIKENIKEVYLFKLFFINDANLIIAQFRFNNI